MRFLLLSIKFWAVSDYCRHPLEKRADSQTNMVRKYGSSLPWRVVFLHVTHHLSPGEIVRLLKVEKTFVHEVLKLYSETIGVEYSLNHNRGKPRSIGGK